MKRIFILLMSISICMFVLTSCGEDKATHLRRDNSVNSMG